jgi:deoxycytidine triphosphate deaminase
MSNGTILKEDKKFVEEYLWRDPFEDDEQFRSIWKSPFAKDEKYEDYKSAVLLAEEIQAYVELGLLIAEGFYLENLKGASYSMRPDPTEAWKFDDTGEISRLEKGEDEDGSYLLVPKNALVHIRLQQKLRLPYYIIGRHNLTIKYVYQGLLLGTGPQVDPGYIGNLFIPLHNFTNRPVKIYLEKSFVSIDFVRTSRVRLNKGVPKSDEEFRKLYKEKCPIDRRKIERLKLKDYLKGATPTSSIGKLVPELEKAKEESKSVINKMESLHRLDIIAVAILVITMLGIWMTTYYILNDKVDSKTKVLYGEGERLKNTEVRIKELEQVIKGIERNLQSRQEIWKLKPEKDKNTHDSKNEYIQSEIKDIKK